MRTIAKRYPPSSGKPADDYLVVTGTDENELISSRVGGTEVLIRGNTVSTGYACVSGMQDLTRLRDALIEVCATTKWKDGELFPLSVQLFETLKASQAQA